MFYIANLKLSIPIILKLAKLKQSYNLLMGSCCIRNTQVLEGNHAELQEQVSNQPSANVKGQRKNGIVHQDIHPEVGSANNDSEDHGSADENHAENPVDKDPVEGSVDKSSDIKGPANNFKLQSNE